MWHLILQHVCLEVTPENLLETLFGQYTDVTKAQGRKSKCIKSMVTFSQRLSERLQPLVFVSGMQIDDSQ